MSESSTTDSAPVTSTESNAGGNAVSPPTTTPPAQPSGISSTHIDSLTQAITAIPETVARAVKEAVGTPKSAPSSSPDKNTAQETDKGTAVVESNAKSHAAVPGKKKSFSDWWFNG